MKCRRSGKLIFNLIVALLLFSMTVTSTFAWLQLRKKSDVSMTVGEGAEISLFYATFERTPNAPDPGFGQPEPGRYRWYKGGDLKNITEFGGKFKDDGVLQMGTISNLLYRVESNVTWFALKIKTAGNRVFSNLRLSLKDPVIKIVPAGQPNVYHTGEGVGPFDLYTGIDTTTTPPTATHHQDEMLIKDITDKYIERLILMDNMTISDLAPDSFLPNSTFLTSAEEGPVAIAEPGVTDDKFNPSKDGLDPKKITCNTPHSEELKSAGITKEHLSYSGEYTGEAQEYYVYIRVVPVLDAYGDMAVDISLLMPCVLTYNLIFEVTTQSKILPPEPPAPPAPTPTPGA